MSLKLKSTFTKKSNNGRVEEGTYFTRIAQIIDMGMQAQTDWQTQEVKLDDSGQAIYKHEIMVTFEFPTERMEIKGESKPRWLSKNYTVSMHEKAALVALIKAIAPNTDMKGFDVSKLVGAAAMVTVGSTASGNAKISSVAGVPKGMAIANLENDQRVFDIHDPDMDVWDALPEWVCKKIIESPTVRGTRLEELILSPQHEDRPTKRTPAESKESDPNFDSDEIPF